MRRVIDFLLVVLGTFYLAVIYNSKSLVFLGFAEISIVLLLLIYNLLVFWKIKVFIETPFGITELQKKVPIRIVIRNDSVLPAGKLQIQLSESYALERRKKKVVFYAAAAGRKRGSGKSYGLTVINTSWQPRSIGKAVVELEKVRCFDLMGILALPLPKRKIRMKEQIMVLPQIFPVPVEIGERSREFAVERERYLQGSTQENDAEQFWIREYRQGDRLRSIHWKLSAKRDDLMVREYLPSAGCPVLFFLDWRDLSEKKKGKKRFFTGQTSQEEKEAFFSILLSVSSSIACNDCRHYVIWYDGKQKDVMRCYVEKEEDIYQLLMKIEDLNMPAADINLEEEYYHKYREKSYVTKLLLNRRLQLFCNEELLVSYSGRELEKNLTTHTIYL